MTATTEGEPPLTKTAAHKRRVAEAKAAALSKRATDYAALEKQRRESKRAYLNTIYCSDWWAEYIQNNDKAKYLPDAPCRCKHCQNRRLWPQPCIGSVGICFECFTLANAPPPRDGRKVSVSEAHALGLRFIRRRGEHIPAAKGAVVLVSGCEGCDGLKPQGERYCMFCRAVVVKEMKEVGYL